MFTYVCFCSLVSACLPALQLGGNAHRVTLVNQFTHHWEEGKLTTVIPFCQPQGGHFLVDFRLKVAASGCMGSLHHFRGESAQEVMNTTPR